MCLLCNLIFTACNYTPILYIYTVRPHTIGRSILYVLYVQCSMHLTYRRLYHLQLYDSSRWSLISAFLRRTAYLVSDSLEVLQLALYSQCGFGYSGRIREWVNQTSNNTMRISINVIKTEKNCFPSSLHVFFFI